MDQLLDWKRIRIRAFFVATLCLAGAVLAVMALLGDLRGRRVGGGTAMATLERMEEKVRVKHAGSFAWSQIEQADALYRKDSIQTGDGSAASVKLKDGTTLELGENSLVVIDDLSELSLNFGQLVVRKSTGEDAQITVDRGGKKKVETIVARLTAPENFARFFTAWKVPSPKVPVDFKWELKSPEARPAFVQVSRDKRFLPGQTQSIPVGDAERTAAAVSAPVGIGRFFWRIVTEDQRPLSTAAQFRVAAAFGLRPVLPAADKPVVIWGNGGAVQFRWANPLVALNGMTPAEAPEAGDFTAAQQRLEISAASDFTALIQNVEILPLSGNATINGLRPGHYFWRIKGRMGTVPVVSAALDFTVEEGKRLAVQLAYPAAEAVIEHQPKQRFAWTTDSIQGTDYFVELKDSAGAVKRTDKNAAKSYVWPSLSTGKYTWRVVAFSDGQSVGESEWRSFQLVQGKPLTVRSPAMGEDVFHWKEQPNFSFSWDPDNEVEKNPGVFYQFELSRTPEFKEVAFSRKGRETRVGASEMKLADGAYHWRVKVVSPQGETLKSSAPRAFKVAVHPPLRAPASTQISPPPGAVVNYQQTPGGVMANWSALDGAQAYEVTVRSKHAAPGSKPIFQKRVTENKVSLGEIPEGDYVWSIRAVDVLGRMGEALPARELKTTYGAQLGAPVLKTKEVQ